MDQDNQVYFREQQAFTQLWLWVPMIAFLIIPLNEILLDTDYGRKAPDSMDSLVALLVMLLLPAFMLSLRLKTIIKSDGIYVRFSPFHLKFHYYDWAQIDKCFVRTYNPIGEYGGWGLRGFKNKKAFNVSGNNGIQLVFHDGKSLLIGTNLPDEATAALRKLHQLHQ
jgi:hypothetical protein